LDPEKSVRYPGTIKLTGLGAFFAALRTAKNRAIRSNSSQSASRFAPGFPLLSLALG
jgi:hypothetical protein